MNPPDDPYADREQSQIKHIILESYLGSFAHKILLWADGLTYVDAFAGPWQTTDTDSFEDSSFGIALAQLRSARDFWQGRGKSPKIECIFLEKDRKAFQQLHAFSEKQNDISVRPINQPFEEAIPQIVQAIRSKGPRWFPFVLVDPKGWKGFRLSSIAPLIQLQPCEVLVNFMTGHIQRFIRMDNLTIQEGFRQLYDSDEYADRLANLSGQDREDAMVFAYAERLAEVGGYRFVSTALVQNPIVDRTYYHLVYATRHIKGIEVFKTAERKALKLAPTIRAKAKNRRQEAKTGQSSLFSPEDLPDTDHLLKLQEHFEQKAEDALRERLEGRNEVSYDDLYALAMRFPIVQEPFLCDWLADHAQPISSPEGTPKIGLNFRFRGKTRC
jgi:three-Cys-motif partner protein